MSNASALRQAVMSHCYRLVLPLNFLVTVELLYDQAGSDFVQCQTKMRAFASRICSEFKQIELNWNRIVHQNALWSLVFSTTRPWNKQISAPDASQPSSQERWQVADLKHLKNSYIFSLPRISTKDFPYIKEKIDWSIGINDSSVDFKWTQVFLCLRTFIIHRLLKEQYPVTADTPNFDFRTGCREIKRCEESKRTLKNPFASRFAEFNTTLKHLRVTDQWCIVLVKFRFGRNRIQLNPLAFYRKTGSLAV